MGTSDDRRCLTHVPTPRQPQKDHPPLEGATLGGSLTFYIDVDSADGLRDQIEMVGPEVEIVQELYDTDYGRRKFAIQDTNDYTLWFGGKLEQ